MKKRIHIIATGGTIASKAPREAATSGYAPSAYGAEELIGYIPDIPEDIVLTAEQPFRKQSLEITDDDMVQLTKCIDRRVKQEDVDGVVVLMGTDTLEEVAYFAHLTVHTDKPIVFTGAMRPANVASSDAPLNMRNAILVAAHHQSAGMGVVVAMDDYIVCSRDVLKLSTFKTDSFRGGDYGVIGTIKNGTVQYRYRPIARHTNGSEFDITEIDTIPLVEVVYLFQGCSTRLYRAAVDGGCAGIVFSGFGNGAILLDIQADLRKNHPNIPLIRASRTPMGGGYGDYGYFDQELSTVPSGDLSASKCRILLCLAICYNSSHQRIKEIFTEY